jgi:hypothetical protein
MKFDEIVGDIFKVVLVCGCIYGIVNWKAIETQDDDVRDFAERDCVDEIRDRFDVSTARVYAVSETTKGYVVRATITLARGSTAKVYCLTNRHGGVEEITIQER